MTVLIDDGRSAAVKTDGEFSWHWQRGAYVARVSLADVDALEAFNSWLGLPFRREPGGWRGFVYEMTYGNGRSRRVKSLGDMYNAVAARYTGLVLQDDNLIGNGGFETLAMDGKAFADWTLEAGTGIAQISTGSHAGSRAVQLWSGNVLAANVEQSQAQIWVQEYRLVFWTRGDGVDAGQYQVKNAVDYVDIVARTSTGVVGTTYTQVTVSFTTPTNCNGIIIQFFSPSSASGLAYFDDVLLAKYPWPISVLQNSDFESAGLYVPNPFLGWTEIPNSGAVAATATAQSGVRAVVLTAGASADTAIVQIQNELGAQDYEFSFWTRGDGTNAGRYRILNLYDNTYIVPMTSTGISGAVYTQVTIAFTTPGFCTGFQVEFHCPAAVGGAAYFDNVMLVETPYPVNHLGNPDFEVSESSGGLFSEWREDDGSGEVAVSGTAHSGSRAARVESGEAIDAMVWQRVGKRSGEAKDYELTFWTHGNGGSAGRYQIWNISDDSAIVALASTGVASTTYTAVTVAFTAPVDCSGFRIEFYSPDSGYAYFDSVTLFRYDDELLTTVWALNDSSIARYGRRDYMITDTFAFTLAQAEAARAVFLAQNSWPWVRSADVADDVSGEWVEIVARGNFDKLYWRIADLVAAVDISTAVSDLVTSYSDIAIGRIAANAVVPPDIYRTRVGNILAQLAKLGDGGDTVYQMFLSDDGLFIYWPVSVEVPAYFGRDGLIDANGAEVWGELVRPGLLRQLDYAVSNQEPGSWLNEPGDVFIGEVVEKDGVVFLRSAELRDAVILTTSEVVL